MRFKRIIHRHYVYASNLRRAGLLRALRKTGDNQGRCVHYWRYKRDGNYLRLRECGCSALLLSIPRLRSSGGRMKPLI